MTLKFNPKTGEWEGTTGGVDLTELSKRQPKPVYKKVETQKQIHNDIIKNDHYAYALRLIDHVATQMEVKLGRTIFRNRQASCYDSQTNQIYLSYQNLDKVVKTGFTEYPTVGHIWRKHGYKGRKYRKGQYVRTNEKGQKLFASSGYWKFEMTGNQGIWAVVLHEVAHAIQDQEGYQRNGRRWDLHGKQFQRILNELIILFPYEEVKNV